jgi:hypothetical protein
MRPISWTVPLPYHVLLLALLAPCPQRHPPLPSPQFLSCPLPSPFRCAAGLGRNQSQRPISWKVPLPYHVLLLALLAPPPPQRHPPLPTPPFLSCPPPSPFRCAAGLGRNQSHSLYPQRPFFLTPHFISPWRPSENKRGEGQVVKSQQASQTCLLV